MYLLYGLFCICSVECEHKGVRYIGQTTKTLNERLYGHITAAQFGKRYPVYNWLRKHGVDNIRMVKIRAYGSRSESDKAEIEYIANLTSMGSCLNVRVGGDSMSKSLDKLKTHCPRGHKYIRSDKGKTWCRECNRDRNKKTAEVGFGPCINGCHKVARCKTTSECNSCYKKRLRAEGAIVPKVYGFCACGGVAAYKVKMQCNRCYQKQRRDSARLESTIGL